MFTRCRRPAACAARAHCQVHLQTPPHCCLCNSPGLAARTCHRVVVQQAQDLLQPHNVLAVPRDALLHVHHLPICGGALQVRCIRGAAQECTPSGPQSRTSHLLWLQAARHPPLLLHTLPPSLHAPAAPASCPSSASRPPPPPPQTPQSARQAAGVRDRDQQAGQLRCHVMPPCPGTCSRGTCPAHHKTPPSPSPPAPAC